MEPVSFTFVLPTFNAAGSSFERALGSIRAQAYPTELVELIVADGGSTDETRAVAERFGARVIENPNRLAEWGVKLGMLAARGDAVVVFAADNELVGPDWLNSVAALFAAEPQLAAVYGRLVSGEDDPPLNKYIQLIQSEPMNWFLNRNLDEYLSRPLRTENGFALFRVDPAQPLVWGANGLVVRRAWAAPAWDREGYVADVDAFHSMMRAGHDLVAYNSSPYCYHHQVATLGDLRRKWLRNAGSHLVEQASNRELDWVFTRGFRGRGLAWVVYSYFPLLSGADAVRRALRDRSAYWLYHPLVTFLQATTYAQVLVSSGAGRRLLKRALVRRS